MAINTFNAYDTEPSELVIDDSLDINVIPLGPAGVTSPVGIFNTISVLCQQVVCTPDSSDVVIDRSLGQYVELVLQNDVTSLTIQNWPTDPHLGQIYLDIYNQGAFIINWPQGTQAPNAVAPQVTPNGNDFIIIGTIDGGTTIKIHVVTSNYLPIS